MSAPQGNTQEVEFSIIIPTYNERPNIGLVVSLLDKTFEALRRCYEVVIVDDSSPDRTQEIVARLQEHYGEHKVVLLARPKMRDGLGTAYKDGVKLAKGNFVVLMDADMSHNPEDLAKFIKKQEKEEADIVIGSRYAPSGGIGGWNFRRRLISRGANVTARALLNAKASDLTGSYRLYKTEVLKELLAETHSRNYAFQMEVVVRAERKGLKICEVPIWFVDRLFGQSKLGMHQIFSFLWILLILMIRRSR